MPKLVWLNGSVMPLETAVVSAADHAHLYGDGLFEGIRFYNRKIFRFDEHLRRLYHGIAYLGFEMHIAYDQLREVILETCKQADLPDGYIRLNVTRGTGLGLDPKNIDRQPNVIVIQAPRRGPIRLAAPQTLEKSPCTRALSSSE